MLDHVHESAFGKQILLLGHIRPQCKRPLGEFSCPAELGSRGQGRYSLTMLILSAGWFGSVWLPCPGVFCCWRLMGGGVVAPEGSHAFHHWWGQRCVTYNTVVPAHRHPALLSALVLVLVLVLVLTAYACTCTHQRFHIRSDKSPQQRKSGG